MAERPLPRVEFLKKSYLRHLETGEKPNLEDLIHQTPPRYLKDFFSQGKPSRCPRKLFPLCSRSRSYWELILFSHPKWEGSFPK